MKPSQNWKTMAIVTLTIGILAVGSAWAGPPTKPPAKYSGVDNLKDMSIRYATMTGKKHATFQGLNRYWPAVEKASGGKIKARIFAGGVLLGAKETLRGVRDGTAESGHVVATYEAAALPHYCMLVDMAMILDDGIAAAGATSELMCLQSDLFKEDLVKNEIQMFGVYATSTYGQLAKVPIRSVDDVRGKKVRCGGHAWVRAAKYLDAVPVQLSLTDTYEGLQRGTLDILWGATDYLRSYKFWDIIKYVTEYPLGAFNGTDTPAFGNKFWEPLPKVAKRILIDHILIKDAQAKEMAIKKGVKFIKPNADLAQKIDEFKKQDLENIIDYAVTERKIDKGRAIAIRDNFVRTYKKWKQISAEEVKGDRDRFEAVLYREIYGPLVYKLGLVD
jgi:TRAP-type C4-dicarboxylate transport system substrate-binding protein